MNEAANVVADDLAKNLAGASKFAGHLGYRGKP
jgi:hypothetical protein